jgi:hypothetical protein
LIAYSDGEVRQEFTFVYAAEIESGELKIDDESKEASWVPLMSAVELPLAESQRRRLKDVVEYQKNRQTVLRWLRCLRNILRMQLLSNGSLANKAA